MAKVDLIGRDWCEIVFEGRNKEYGAYRLRASAGKRNRAALIILLIGIAAIAAALVINTAVQNALKASRQANEEVTALSQLKKEEPKKEEKKVEKQEYEKPKEQQVAVKASIQFTVPKIVDDDKVEVDKKLKTQDEVTKSSFAVATQSYEGDSKNGINIDDLKENQKAGGTTVPPKEEEILANELIEQQAVYPGGEAALLAYVTKNTKYPAVAQEQELQGTVLLRFVVEKDGSVGDVIVKKSLSRECDREAVRVVKTLKRFTPARQQGHPVRVWFTLPVRFEIH